MTKLARFRSSSQWRFIASFCVLGATFVGCQPNEPMRVAVQGTVVIEGAPVPNCRIVFASLEGAARNASGIVIDGRFQIQQSEGPSEGRYAILLEDIQPDLEDYEASKSSDAAPLFAKSVPDRYSRWNELEAVVKERGPNQFNFQLNPR